MSARGVPYHPNKSMWKFLRTVVGIAGDAATFILNAPRTTKKARMIFCGKAAIVGRDSACRINLLLKGWCRNERWWLYKSLGFLKDAVEIPQLQIRTCFGRERSSMGLAIRIFSITIVKKRRLDDGPDETPQACPLRWWLMLCLRRRQQKKDSGFKNAGGLDLGQLALKSL